MDATLTIEPFGFFTLESLRAGWYMIWRQLVRIVPLIIGAVAVGGALSKLGMAVLGILIMTLGVVAAVIWGAVLVPQLTSRWAEGRYGYSLTAPGSVWWGITWRVWVASLIAAVIFTPPNFVALSLSTAFANGALGMLGQLLATLLGVANFAVTVLATGWAMSRVTASQLSGMPVPSAPFVPEPSVIEPAPVASTVIEPVYAAVSFQARSGRRPHGGGSTGHAAGAGPGFGAGRLRQAVSEVRSVRDRARHGDRLVLPDLRLARVAPPIRSPAAR